MTPHLNNNNNNKNTNPIISRQDYHLTQPCPSEKIKQTNNNHKNLSIILTLYKAYTNYWINFRRAETKKKKEFNLLQGKNLTFLETWKNERPQTQ